MLLAFIAIAMRISLLGFHDYPAQATSLDSSYNIAMTEWMAAGNFWEMPPYLALGHEDVIQYHPPLLYAFPALISKIIQPWNAAWLYFAVLSGLSTIVLFFIGKKMISEEAGMIGAALYVFPPLIWTYPLHSGMWGAVAGQFFLVLELLLLCIYIEKRSKTAAMALGVTVALQLLSHFPETFIFIPFMLIVLAKIHPEKLKISNLALILGPALIASAWLAPKLKNVWLPQVHTGLHIMPEITSRLDSIIDISGKTSISALGLTVIAFLALGFYFLFQDRKWYWAGAGFYFISIPLIAPYFSNEAEFFVKMRFFMPLIAYPIAAYGAVRTIEQFSLRKKLFVPVIVIAIIGVSLLTFMEQEKGTYSLTEEKYQALKWIEQNTPENATIIYYGYEGFTSSFAHRTCFEAESGDSGLWCGLFWSGKYRENYLLPHEKRYWEYEYYQAENATLEQFDYAVYAGVYKEVPLFEEIYFSKDIHIAKNCRKAECKITSSP